MAARLSTLTAHLRGAGGGPASPDAAATSSAGLLSRVGRLLGFTEGEDEGGAEGTADVAPGPPAAGGQPELGVLGTVAGCYLRPSDEQRQADGWSPATDSFVRNPVDSLRLTPGQPDGEPASGQLLGGAVGDHSSHTTTPQPGWLADPAERAVLCQTAEGYEKLRAGLPPGNAEWLGPQRPLDGRSGWFRNGAGENLYLDGIEQGTLCVGDVFKVGGATLEVASPRRPCEKWNVIHGSRADGRYDDPSGAGNIRHFVLQVGSRFYKVRARARNDNGIAWQCASKILILSADHCIACA
eukprot:SAG22_NODE_3929_length_1464_cov_3.465201_2_plen_297_part_00